MRSRWYFVSSVLLLPAVSAALWVAGTSAQSTVDSESGIYVLTAPGTWGAAQDEAVQKAGGMVTYRHGPSGIGVATSVSPNFVKKVKASGAIAQVNLDEMVQWQEPIQEVELEEEVVTPGDETFINSQWNLVAIEAAGAWDAGYTGSGVRVAILDGGIHKSHVDLDGNLDLAASRSYVPGFTFDQDTGTFWHGTHVAGIVAAEDNGIGTVGVAPGATLIGVKVLHSGSGLFSWLIMAILYAADPVAEGGAGADIINMSLGALFPKGGGPGTGQLIGAVNRAVNYATERNVLVVSAAGNAAFDLDHTASYVQIPAQSGSGIAVSATGPVGYGVGWPSGAMNFRRPASYTNYGNSLVWVAAPGGDFVLPGSDLCAIPRCCGGPAVTFPCWVHDMVVSTARGAPASVATYAWAAGTSMAAPAVSGVAALVKQRFPGISVGDLKNHIAQTADDEGAGGHDPFYGRGFVNARRAATEAGAMSPSPLPESPSAGSATVAADLWLTPRPNPTRAWTAVHFGLPRDTEVSLAIYDVRGRQVRELVSGLQTAGEHRAAWDLRDDANRSVASGLYFAILRAEGRVLKRSIVALR
jgi:subtilisin family serine protease